MMMMMIKKKCFCVALVVVLVVISCGPVLSNAEGADRPVINPIFRLAIVEACLLHERPMLEKYRDEIIKVEIRHVGDMIYKANGIITADIGYERPEADPIDQFPTCKYELTYNSGKFAVPDESPFKIISFSCVG